MAFTSLTSAQVQAGEPVTTSLQTKIKDNFDNHETRILNVEGTTASIDIWNQVFKLPEIKVGQAIWSYDTLTQLQATGLSSSWVRAIGVGTWTDGGSTSRNVPDAADRFLRMASTYSAVNVADLVADSTAVNGLATVSGGSHTHTMQYGIESGSATTVYAATSKLSATSYSDSDAAVTWTDADSRCYRNASSGSHTHTLSGDSETAPIHIKQDLIFKKAYTYGELKLLYKAKSALFLNSVTLMQIEAGGNATTLEIDVKHGTLTELKASTLTSIFTTKPKVISDGSTDFVENSGTLNVSEQTVATGEYIELSISSYQTGVSEFFIQLGAA